MVSARDAREWAASGALQRLGDSLYTPFSGRDGDDIDWDAYRVLVRYCVGDLGHDMLWLTSGVGEWWSLTLDERKRLLEVAVEEARAIDARTVIQACTAASSAKEAAELTLHAQEHGADMAYIQTPPMEAHGGEGVLRFFEYVADRTDLALGMFNSPSSGYVLTPQEMAAIHHALPRVIAVKQGEMDSTMPTMQLHALAPELVIWECDTYVYEAGWMQDGIVGGGQLGTTGYLSETVDDMHYTEYWHLIWEGKLQEAHDQRRDRMMAMMQAMATGGSAAGFRFMTTYPDRPDYFTHWGEAFKCASEALGLPIGDWPYSRPPQARLPEGAREEIHAYAEMAGFAGKALTSKAVSGSLQTA